MVSARCSPPGNGLVTRNKVIMDCDFNIRECSEILLHELFVAVDSSGSIRRQNIVMNVVRCYEFVNHSRVPLVPDLFKYAA